ncbi:MAG: hypothetical protein J6X66_10250 [Lachnospiraceae bacterium]|nr:hypothetical protein [Lachnospiraceae bacterium]
MPDEKTRINRFMLKAEMLLAAPGKGLHMMLKRMRGRKDMGRALFLLFILLLVGLGLWLMRKNTVLLVAGGTVLAVVAFLLYKPVLKALDTFFIFLEAGTHMFAKSYDDCKKAIERYDHAHRTEEQKRRDEEKARQEKAREEELRKERERRRAEEARAREERMKAEWSRVRQEARQEKRREHTERKRRRMEDEAQRERDKRGGPHVKTDKEPHVSNAALNEAKSIFNVEVPFTEEEIKEKRNLLIKKYHPDNPGGSEEMCKKINECYAILYKYTT